MATCPSCNTVHADPSVDDLCLTCSDRRARALAAEHHSRCTCTECRWVERVERSFAMEAADLRDLHWSQLSEGRALSVRAA